jgi:hypothetical protein
MSDHEYVIISDHKNGRRMFYRAAATAPAYMSEGLNPHSQWVFSKEKATVYDDYYVAAGSISHAHSWVSFSGKNAAFSYPRVVNREDC